MHLPDGFLDTKTAVLSAGAAALGLGLAVRRVKSVLEPRHTPLLGLAAAFVFAAQMLNFPIVGGTSGHLLGGQLPRFRCLPHRQTQQIALPFPIHQRL